MAKENKATLATLAATVETLKRRLSSLEKRPQGIFVSEEQSRIELPFEYVSKNFTPVFKYMNSGDAGFDLYADRDYYVVPGHSIIVKTGIRVAVPAGYELQIRARSGISLKTDLRVANGVGTIDSGFRDEIGVIIHNAYRFNNIAARVVDIQGKKVERPPKGYPKLTYLIRKGDRIAQAVLAKVCQADFKAVSSVQDIGTNRGGGFGSSGIR